MTCVDCERIAVDIAQTVQLEVVDPMKARIGELEAQRDAVLELCDKVESIVTPPWHPIVTPADVRRALGVTE